MTNGIDATTILPSVNPAFSVAPSRIDEVLGTLGLLFVKSRNFAYKYRRVIAIGAAVIAAAGAAACIKHKPGPPPEPDQEEGGAAPDPTCYRTPKAQTGRRRAGDPASSTAYYTAVAASTRDFDGGRDDNDMDSDDYATANEAEPGDGGTGFRVDSEITVLSPLARILRASLARASDRLS